MADNVEAKYLIKRILFCSFFLFLSVSLFDELDVFTQTFSILCGAQTDAISNVLVDMVSQPHTHGGIFDVADWCYSETVSASKCKLEKSNSMASIRNTESRASVRFFPTP